jgi:hypothetical protein
VVWGIVSVGVVWVRCVVWHVSGCSVAECYDFLMCDGMLWRVVAGCVACDGVHSVCDSVWCGVLGPLPACVRVCAPHSHSSYSTRTAYNPPGHGRGHEHEHAIGHETTHTQVQRKTRTRTQTHTRSFTQTQTDAHAHVGLEWGRSQNVYMCGAVDGFQY